MDDARLADLVREMAKIFVEDACASYDALDPRLRVLVSGGEFTDLVKIADGKVRVTRDRSYR